MTFAQVCEDVWLDFSLSSLLLIHLFLFFFWIKGATRSYLRLRRIGHSFLVIYQTVWLCYATYSQLHFHVPLI